MKELNFDLIIVGGGLSGLLTAYSLSKLNINIAVLDKFDFGNIDNHKKDLRTTAIAEGSKLFLEKIKFWREISNYAESIKDIRVFDRGSNNNIVFQNKNYKKNLGYIIKNSTFKIAILKILNKTKNITIISNFDLKKIDRSQDKIICISNKNKIISSLLIAADGKNSKVAELLNAQKYKKIYNHKAIVINFHHKKNHHNIAHEIFLKDGPLAILPVKKNKKLFYSSSVIWSNKPDYADSLLNINKPTLSLILEEKIKEYIGPISEIVDIQSFPLSAHINKKFFDERVIYLGDSAHSVHPIAGQGWNLAIRDIKTCSSLLKKNIALGLDIGSASFCLDYHNSTYFDSYTLYQITDKLNSIFLSEKSSITSIRNIGFGFINSKKNLKNIITKYAMGF